MRIPVTRFGGECIVGYIDMIEGDPVAQMLAEGVLVLTPVAEVRDGKRRLLAFSVDPLPAIPHPQCSEKRPEAG